MKDAKDAPPAKDPHLVRELGPTPDDLYGVSWSKDTKTIATAGYAGHISVWDLADPKPKFSLRIKSPAYCVTFAPDGKSVASGHDNGTVQFIRR
jgi:WD40 repeat protein